MDADSREIMARIDLRDAAKEWARTVETANIPAGEARRQILERLNPDTRRFLSGLTSTSMVIGRVLAGLGFVKRRASLGGGRRIWYYNVPAWIYEEEEGA